MSPNSYPRLVKVDFLNKDQIPSFMHEFIEKVTNGVGDGHCGFCVVVGIHAMYDDDYKILRYQLLKELTDDNNECYL
jgi:hypothetical protein